MDKCKKNSEFKEDFGEFIDESRIDDQRIKDVMLIPQYLVQIKKIIKYLPMLKKSSDFTEYSLKLTQYIQALMMKIEEKKCAKTKAALINLFKGVDENIFSHQLNLLNETIKK